MQADAGAPPSGWRLLHVSRAAVVFRVGDDVLVKRVNAVRFGTHVAPLWRVVIEASAPLYLGPWAPQTLYVDPKRGILVRRYVPGESLAVARVDQIDLAAIARELGRWLQHLSTVEGPGGETRPLPILCAARLRTARTVNPAAVDALTARILNGSQPCHGDVSASNVIVTSGKRVALVDAETLDRASVAWDLGHALTLATRLSIPLATWREALLRTADLPSSVVKDADLVWACLTVRSNDDPARCSEALAHLRAAN